MTQLATPRKPHKGEDPGKIYWRDDPKLLETLYEYNRIDVEMTAEIVGLYPAAGARNLAARCGDQRPRYLL
jgi:hypothetical protein